MNTIDRKVDLHEGLEMRQQERLGDLAPVESALSAWQAPDPDAEEQSAFVMRLAGQLPQPYRQELGWRGWLGLILAQARLFEAEFWYACAAMLLFTLAGGVFMGRGGYTLFALMGSPLIAVACVLYVYQRESSSLAALEAASPVGSLALFYCRLALILGMNLALLPLCLLPGQFFFPQMDFWRVVAVWLGVLVGLFGLATYSTVRWNGLMGSVIPLGIWGLLVVSSWQQAVASTGSLLLAPAWLMNGLNHSNGLLAAAGAAVLMGGWLLYQAGRQVKKINGLWA